VQLGIVWGKNLKADYSDYTVKAYKNGSKDTLTFVKSETRRGYIPAGTINFKAILTEKSGETRVVNSKSMSIVGAPNDNITLTFDVKESEKYDLNLSFNISNDMEEKVIDLSIPNILIAKDAPSISSDNINNGVLNFTEGVGTNAKIDIKSPGYLDSCILKVNSKELNDYGIPAVVELVGLKTRDVNTYNKLKTIGLEWIDEIGGSKLSYLDFTGVTKFISFNSANNKNDFSILVKDIQKQSSEEFKFSLTPSQAKFEINNIPDGDIWAKYIFVNYSTENGNIEKMKVEYCGDDKIWKEAKVEVVEKLEKSCRVKVIDMLSGSNYTFRVRYNNGVSKEVKVVTEASEQLPNSGFEEWTEGVYGYRKQPIFYPWKDGGEKRVWDTNNKAVMPSGYTTISNDNFKCFPTASYSTTARTGKSSAQIMAVALNNFNTSGTSLSDAVAGILYTGSADNNTNNTEFISRPMSVSFFYQYTPKGGSANDTFEAYIEVKNGNTVIGTGTFTKNVEKSEPVNTWTEATQTIKYTNTTLKATHIAIRFKSSTMDKPTYQLNTVVYLAGREYRCHGGSVLLIDDLTLNY
jgi:hypothetical protein